MAAGPIGSVWASGSWTDVCWEENTWAATLGYPTTLGDLTTLYSAYLETLREDYAPEDDMNTMVVQDRDTIRAASNVVNDENTMYAQALS